MSPILLLLGSVLVADFCWADEITKDSFSASDSRVQELLTKMTQEEKIKLVGGATDFTMNDVKRLGIPSLLLSDGPVGVRPNGGKSTVYAGGMGLAASWDVAMAEKMGVSMGHDCRARGIHIILGPGMDMYRAPMCGRNAEYFGEDPLLTGYIAAAYVHGVQSQGVGATVKHFVANDQEFDRNKIDSKVDERTLREIYLKPFEIAIRESNPCCVMDSYNPVNGIHATANDWLNNIVLKKEWGFKGFVMSDWWASHDTLGTANGGLDLEMPGDEKMFFKAEKLRPLLNEGKVSQATLDDKVRRILTVMVTMGFLDRPQLDSSLQKDSPDSQAVALQTAQEGVVLLKNEGKLLPLEPGKVKKIVVLGHNADPAVAALGGSGQAAYYHATSVLQGLKDAVGGDAEVVRVPWSTLPGSTDFSKNPQGEPYALTAYGAGKNPPIPEAFVDQVKEADLAVVCVGFSSYTSDYWNSTHTRPDNEGEDVDRTYALPPGQENVIKAVAKLNPHTIVVLNAGGSVATSSWIGDVPVLLDAFYPGQAGGQALAEIIFGKTSPSGKLPFTWEKELKDCPSIESYPIKENHGKNDYTEGVFMGYRGYDSKKIEPLFPFGFGMNYTTFVYTNLALQPAEGGDLVATFSIQNTGPAAGSEIAQLYVAPPTANVPRPLQELKGFTRVSLEAGESKTVSINVKKADLAYWDPQAKQWTVTPGDYTAMVGSSSRDLPLNGKFTE